MDQPHCAKIPDACDGKYIKYPIPNSDELRYHQEAIDNIPNNPPDYRLIWENGYTGKEDIKFITTDDCD